MAERPIFVPSPDTPELVKEILCQLEWNPGFAPVQKKKNIEALHAAAAKRGLSPLLEVSTKSESPLGQFLSAFNLKVHTSKFGDIPMELAFQGGKVFEHGGPFFCGFNQHGATVLLIHAPARQAFRLQRVHNAAGGGRTHLLGPGQIVQGNRPAKDDHGKRGQTRRADAAGGVLHADQAQQVYGGAVQVVGQLFGFCGFPHLLARLTIFLTKVNAAFIT